MKPFLKNNSVIIIPYLLLLGFACFFIFTIKKTEIHLYLNQFVGNAFFDKFYYYITFLGDGNIAILLLIILFLYNIRIGIYTTLTFLFASLASISLKHFLFDEVNRPFFIFTYYEKHTLRLVDGVQIFIHNSFPSGHATQAFAIFISLAFCLPNKLSKVTLLALATLTAYSRVYISQHWLVDITAGSVLGFGFSTLFYFVVFKHSKLNKFNYSVFNFKKT